MALDTIKATIANLREQAADALDDYENRSAIIFNNPALTPEGKREQITPLHDDLVNTLANLRAQEKTLVQGRREALEVQVFGLNAVAGNDPLRLLAYRDAQDRASAITDSDEGERVYRTAVQSSDSTLQAAILARALEFGWQTIVEAHLERNPDTRVALQDLADIVRYQSQSLMNNANYMAPSLPHFPVSAGFVKQGGQTASNQPTRVPNLADVIAQRIAQSPSRYGY